MSEQLHNRHERPGEQDKNPYGERKLNHETTTSLEKEKTYSEIKELLNKVEKHADTSENIEAKHVNPHTQTKHAKLSHGAQSISAQRQIKEVQRHLRGSDRQLSKLIHNPTVETISDVAGATVARPSALMVGGITSFISSIVVVIVCRFYGYEYNYTIALISFGGGFLLGAFFELISRALSRK